MGDKIRVTKEFVFDMAHALLGYDGPCKDIHGHTYHLFVTIIGSPIHESGNPKDGMVVDFGEIKKVVQEKVIRRFDHALVLNESLSPDIKAHIGAVTGKIAYLPVQPSCENLLLTFKNELQPVFASFGWQLHSLRLNETPTSFAEWFAEDNA